METALTPVDTWLVSVESVVLRETLLAVAVEALTTVVESDADRLLKALAALETWADVGVPASTVSVERVLESVAVMLVVEAAATDSVERLADSTETLAVATETEPLSEVLADVAPDRLALADRSLESAAEMLDESTTIAPDVALERFVLWVVRPIVAVDRSDETDTMMVLRETSPDVTAEVSAVAIDASAVCVEASAVQVEMSDLTSSASAMPPIV